MFQGSSRTPLASLVPEPRQLVKKVRDGTGWCPETKQVPYRKERDEKWNAPRDYKRVNGRGPHHREQSKSQRWQNGGAIGHRSIVRRGGDIFAGTAGPKLAKPRRGHGKHTGRARIVSSD